MVQDRNGNWLKAGTRVLILAEVIGIPDRPDGPVTVKVGQGEAFGANISVPGQHLLVHEALAPAPSAAVVKIPVVRTNTATVIRGGKLVAASGPPAGSL